MTKKFVLAPDSFKESMSAKEACLAMEKGILAAKARVAAKRAREVTRKKSGLEISNLPGMQQEVQEYQCVWEDRFLIKSLKPITAY